jgi:hypothetical protein
LGWGNAGSHGHSDSFHFKGAISGFEGPDVTDHADVDLASTSNYENAEGTGVLPVIPEEAQMTELSLPGQHSAHTGSAVVTHQHDLIA